MTQLQNLVISLQIHAFEGYFLLNFFIKRWRWQKLLLQTCDCSAIPFVIAFGYTTNFLFSIFPKVVLDYLHKSQGRRKVELGEKNSGYGCNIYLASWQRRQYFGRIGFFFTLKRTVYVQNVNMMFTHAQHSSLPEFPNYPRINLIWKWFHPDHLSRPSGAAADDFSRVLGPRLTTPRPPHAS